jgi:uracil-DNA glycosylase family 4
MIIDGDPGCRLCKLHQYTDNVCEMGFGDRKADVMVVSRMPNSRTYQEMIEAELAAAGVDLKRVYFTSVVKCRSFDVDPGKKDLKACTETYLDRQIAEMKPKFILGFGNEALAALTPHGGIMKWRGRVEEINGAQVVTTVSPASVTRNPGQKGAWQADLQLFASTINGHAGGLQVPKMAVIDSKDKLQKLERLLWKASYISYDIETAGLDEWDPTGGIVSLAGTMIYPDKDGNDRLLVWVIPLDHPQSVFRKIWRDVLRYIANAFARLPKQIAHNGKYDAKWLRAYGVHAKVTFDTMLAAHLLDENRLKGLKPLGRMLLGVAPWGIDTKDLRNEPIRKVMKYNCLDTFYTHHIYLILREELIAQPRLHRIFRMLTMPANEKLIGVERRGIWIDRQKLESATKIAFEMRDELERELMMHVPVPEDCESDFHSPTPWPKMGKKGKYAEVNFNASNWMRWFMFEYLQFPVIERGKPKENSDGTMRPGDPSLAEATIVRLKDLYPDHPVLKLLEERAKWEKYCSTYVTRYQEVADENDRIHTTFKLAGTVTGRLSSGKEDEEKITATRDRRRGVNLQQVPRDPFIRGLFGAPPGWSFVEADFGQIEFRLAVFVSRDANGLRLIRNGVDVHLEMAAKMTGKPRSQVTKDERKAAKPVNFGFLFGMYWKKFMETAKMKYGIDFSEDEAKANRVAFFDMYPGIQRWHNRQKRLVHNHGRVQSPLGRIRHLPDIYSADKMVVMEAERQAINSPVQSMASDMCVLAMILIDDEFIRQGIRGHTLGLVHDAVNFEIHNDDLVRALPIIKDIMEHLPLKKKFGVDMDIPIEADLKVGTHWGDAKEVTTEQAYNFQQYIHEFVEERAA